MSNKNKRAWKYTDDLANDYVRAASGAIVTQLDSGNPIVGGGAPAPTDPPLPPNFKPRHVRCINEASGTWRDVVCYTTTCALWTGSVTNVTLEHEGADVVFVRKNAISEKRPRKIGQAT